VRNTRFFMKMNKEPKRQIFVDIAPGGVNHDIFVFCANVCSVWDCIFFSRVMINMLNDKGNSTTHYE
jgi:hypothetical protein